MGRGSWQLPGAQLFASPGVVTPAKLAILTDAAPYPGWRINNNKSGINKKKSSKTKAITPFGVRLLTTVYLIRLSIFYAGHFPWFECSEVMPFWGFTQSLEP
ncbi:hypothetical protein Tco_0044101 [Tanacetum coccineum]